jgi:hypothetical protein
VAKLQASCGIFERTEDVDAVGDRHGAGTQGGGRRCSAFSPRAVKASPGARRNPTIRPTIRSHADPDSVHRWLGIHSGKAWRNVKSSSPP